MILYSLYESDIRVISIPYFIIASLAAVELCRNKVFPPVNELSRLSFVE